MVLDEFSLVASIVRESFYEFVVEFWDTIIQEKPVWNWHIKYLCDELQLVAERVFRREPKEYDLLINVAPGTTKSTVISQMFPAWCWTRFPEAQFICGSYAMDLALKNSRFSRAVIDSEKFRKSFPEIAIVKDTESLFTNTQKGWRFAVGTGGQVLGWHGHFIVVDDPINPQEAHSKADLATANRWMTQTLSRRKVSQDVTVTILVMQRLHQSDPTGDWLERSKGVGIKHICLPAELIKDEHGKPLYLNPPELEKFYVNGLFDPVRLSRRVLESAKTSDLGAYGYAGQMLQHPVPLSGGDFEVEKLILLVEAPKKLERLIRSWDKAGTQDGGNYSVGLLMALDKNGCYGIVDVVRGQWSAANREAMIKQVAKLDGTGVEIELEIEGGSGGKESGENTVKMLAGYTVHVSHPTGDKQARAYPLASQVGAGNVWCLKRPWTRDLIEEFRYSPNGKWNDQIDAASAAFNRLARAKKRIGGW